jgi:hypothetical protein
MQTGGGGSGAGGDGENGGEAGGEAGCFFFFFFFFFLASATADPSNGLSVPPKASPVSRKASPRRERPVLSRRVRVSN